jgi:ketopantoate reductase
MNSAIESITNELGSKMPSFTRTAEAEISARKEIE